MKERVRSFMRRRIMLGPGVEALYQHHPVTLAAALAQINHMARGRHLWGHWESVTAGAAATGRVPDRRKWRQVRDIYVADTEREARKAVLDGCMAKFWSHYFKPICEKLNATDLFRPRGADQSVEVTAEYLVDQGVWFVGDPASVAQQIREQFKVTGGFGTLLQLGSDYSDPWAREGWFRSMELLATEVMPRLGDLVVPEDQVQPR